MTGKASSLIMVSLQVLLVLSSSSLLFAYGVAQVDIIAIGYPIQIDPSASFEVTITIRYSFDDASRYMVWVRIYDYDVRSAIVESKRESMNTNMGSKIYTLSLTSSTVEKEWRLGAQVLHCLREDPGLVHESEIKRLHS